MVGDGGETLGDLFKSYVGLWIRAYLGNITRTVWKYHSVGVGSITRSVWGNITRPVWGYIIRPVCHDVSFYKRNPAIPILSTWTIPHTPHHADAYGFRPLTRVPV